MMRFAQQMQASKQKELHKIFVYKRPKASPLIKGGSPFACLRLSTNILEEFIGIFYYYILSKSLCT